jgi:hypothetical protein
MSKKPYVAHTPIELTGKCKRVKIDRGTHGATLEYVQIQVRFLGYPVFKKWVYKEDIVWMEDDIVEYYDCEACKNGNK